MTKKLIRCDGCRKKEFWTSLLKQYVIWKTGPIKDKDGNYIKDINGNIKTDKIQTCGAKPTLMEAKDFAKKEIIPTLQQYEDVYYEKILLEKTKICPECRSITKKYYDRAFSTRKKQIKEGIKILDKDALIKEMVDDVNRKINQEYAKKMKTEEEKNKHISETN